jgi:hypothetical protein
LTTKVGFFRAKKLQKCNFFHDTKDLLNSYYILYYNKSARTKELLANVLVKELNSLVVENLGVTAFQVSPFWREWW